MVPAHNEAAGIGETVTSLLSADYPSSFRRVVVIADNCSDDTGARAHAAGAEVLVRNEPDRRGKGYALELGFRHALADDFAQGVLVVDADTVVAKNLWHAISSRIAAGAHAIQVTNAVRNPSAGWRPCLQSIAMATINGVRSLGRERWGLSTGLRGTGMAFSRTVLQRVPHAAYGVVEDVEYGVQLGFHGVRVVFASETWIASDAPVTASAALSQRRRWEGGRLALLRAIVPSLLRAAFERRSLILLDLAADLLVPPLAYPALLVLFGWSLELVHVRWSGAASPAWSAWAFSSTMLVSYVLRGLMLSGTGLRGMAALLFAPLYVGWKLCVARPWRQQSLWVRTRRAHEHAHEHPHVHGHVDAHDQQCGPKST